MDEIDKELLELGSYRNFLGYVRTAFEDGRSSKDSESHARQQRFIQSRRFEIFNTFCIERGRAIVAYSAVPLFVFAFVMSILSDGEQTASVAGSGGYTALIPIVLVSAYFAITGKLAWRIGTRTALSPPPGRAGGRREQTGRVVAWSVAREKTGMSLVLC